MTDLKAFTQAQQKSIATTKTRILVTDESVSPFVFGFFQVTMLLPQSVLPCQ
ncbi:MULTISPECIES: hypothetical protein [Colwellia]|uniref:hypothetical protein n=1 Tax=Colwellia TaxID=28228 RepID=UPI0012F9EF34|nr:MULTISPECIES: hypothetical protein [Colwellia]